MLLALGIRRVVRWIVDSGLCYLNSDHESLSQTRPPRSASATRPAKKHKRHPLARVPSGALLKQYQPTIQPIR